MQKHKKMFYSNDNILLLLNFIMHFKIQNIYFLLCNIVLEEIYQV